MFLLRYVPDAVKDEFVNIGVMVLEADGGFAGVQFTRDWRRVRCIDPDVDLEYFAALEAELRGRLADAGDRAQLMKKLEGSLSGAIQLTAAKATEGLEPAIELGTALALYVESRPVEGVRRVPTRRERIAAAMQEAFIDAGVWDAMAKQIAVAQFTRPGDPLKLDCGYRVQGVAGAEMKLFHALAMSANLESAQVMALSYPKIREGMRRELKVEALLTTIVEDDLAREQEGIAFALAVMAESEIRVRAVSELTQVAAEVRSEMRL